MYLEQFFIDGLGCASYLVGCEGAGVAAVVDPDRDIQKYLDAASERGMSITHIIETHLHADHVSGNSDLAAQTGADIYVHEAAQAAFPHQKLTGGDVITLGNVELRVRFTPGHTPESITLLVVDKTRADEPWMALTGDTLFVGDAGRPDLVGMEAARELAGHMHTTLHDEYLTLSDGVMILPGHGAGSLCGKSIGSVLSSTMGYERQHNPALQVHERDAYIDFATADLPEQPGNHKRIKQINRQGPRPLGTVTPRPLTVQAAVTHFRQGAALLDTRSKADYRAKHIPGAVHLEADDQLSNRVGFVLPSDMPVILLLAVGADYNLLLISRFKEEIGAGLNTGIIRAMAGTGRVVTAAGLVFAATMSSFIFSALVVLGQIGTTIGLGLMFDTLIVRSFMTPSIAAMMGRWFWWPLTVRPRPASRMLRPFGSRNAVRALLGGGEARREEP